MRNIFVVTHPESIHHVEARVGGWFDTSLTARGKTQATAIAQALKQRLQETSHPIYTSDLKRTLETAEIIAAEFGASVHRDRDLRELSVGDAEGQPHSYMQTHWRGAPPDQRLDHRQVDNAETLREFATRIYRGVERILAHDETQTIIVTHGYALTYVVAAWIGMPIEAGTHVKFAATSGGITHLHEDDIYANRSVESLNQTQHLHGI